MPTTKFPVIRMRARRSGKCPVCGKSSVLALTFEETVNPYNRKTDGTPKTQSEVYTSVCGRALAWKPDDFTHPKCVGVDA